MKTIKTKVLSAVLLSAVLFLIAAFPAQAASNKVRIYPNSVYSSAITASFSNLNDQVKNLKTSSKNLIAKVTRETVAKNTYSNEKTEKNEVSIGLYAKAEGTYTLSYDVYRKSEKVKTVKYTVYVKKDPVLKSFTYAGKNTYDYTIFTRPKSGVIKVVMNKGYTLKKIELGKYKKIKSEDNKSIESETTYSKIKNGAKITLSTVPYEYKYSSGDFENPDAYYSEHYSKNVYSQTFIRISYIDKYTKELATTTYGLSRYLG